MNLPLPARLRMPGTVRRLGWLAIIAFTVKGLLTSALLLAAFVAAIE